MTIDTEIVTKIETKGLIDAADRIMRELIRTPKFKESIIILLNSIDPPSARSLVRTLFWQDPGLLMSIMGSLPAMINVGSEALAEMVVQMNNMPAPLLQDFLNRVVAGIDGAALGEGVGGMISMLLSLNLAEPDGVLKKGLTALGEGFSRGYAEVAGEAPLTARLESWMAGVAVKARDKDSTTHAIIQAAGKAMKKNPDFVEYVLKPLLEPALKTPAKKSTAAAKKPAKPKQSKKE
jgi:hypothetical protein